jgi:hypothetical protein
MSPSPELAAARRTVEARWLRGSIAFVWLATGLSVLHPYYREVAQHYLSLLGLPVWVMYATCAAEVVLGVRVGVGKPTAWLTVLQVGMIAVFTLILSWLEPSLLVHPYGVLAKNLPLAALIVTTWLHEREGWSRRNLWLLRIGVSSIWIAEGLFAKVLFPQPAAALLAARSGLTPGDPVRFLYWLGIAQTLAGVAALTLSGLPFRILLACQMAALVVLPVLVGLLEPELWVHPFGPLIKNVPILTGTALLFLRWR